jgi:hypothetical protein
VKIIVKDVFFAASFLDMPLEMPLFENILRIPETNQVNERG